MTTERNRTQGPEPQLFLKRYVVGPMQVNCYLVADPLTGDACLIDPGASERAIGDDIRKNGFTLRFIVNTHGHGDHIAANAFYGAPIYIHRLDREFLRDPRLNLSSHFLFRVISPDASHLLEDAEVIALGGLSLAVTHTPGHTPGSIILRSGTMLFTGDTLFKQGVGRTDFPYGDEAALYDSIKRRILVLEDRISIFPGHGDSSTIGDERSSSPFF